MTVLVARLKQAAKWVLAISVLVAVAAVALLRKRRQSVLEPDPVGLALEAYERKVAAGNARAAVEIAVVRTTSRAERARLIDVLNDTDEERGIDRLIAEAERIKAE